MSFIMSDRNVLYRVSRNYLYSYKVCGAGSVKHERVEFCIRRILLLEAMCY